MQIITVMALVQLQGTSYCKKKTKKTLHYSIPIKHEKSFELFFIMLYYNQNTKLSWTGKNPGLFQDVATLLYNTW